MSSVGSILLTVDVEDWFQVENFKERIPLSSWSSNELRVERNIHRLLDLLDSFDGKQTTNNKHRTRPVATFFVLGWVAERLPHLAQEIHDRGHEVASHGYSHTVTNILTTNDLEQELRDSKKLLEDIIGCPVTGYRAPCFSISNDILKLIEDSGYMYDSSFNSFEMNGRYGHLDLSKYGKKGNLVEISNGFYEIPISNFVVRNFIFPLGGGGYFRLIPFSIFKMGVKNILKKNNAYVFYTHPWEFDPEQPRVNEASPIFKFRHYVNLKKTYSKLIRLLDTFNRCRFVSCSQYLQEISQKENRLIGKR